ncbi:MAG TPA: 2OG-Fe(II) oxygenase family protein [Kofleriaceae bacterium]
MLPVFPLATLEHETARLRAACEDIGFFYVANHGVDLSPLVAATHAFFAQPLAEKLRFAMANAGSAWRGYFPVGGELTSGLPDLKEGIYFGDELAPSDPRCAWPMHGQNLFPPGMREVVTAYMTAVEAIGQRVLRALAIALALPPDHFATHLTARPTNLFRIFHYPAGDGRTWGVGEHTDYGLLTLLAQDERGGLEVKTPGGWMAAPPLPDTLVCNLGDMLDRLTGGRFRSTPHRVRNVSGHSRYSWPFFLDPAFDADVRPLPIARVRPVELDAAERWDRASVHTLTGTYGDYLISKVSKVFPGLGRAT